MEKYRNVLWVSGQTAGAWLELYHCRWFMSWRVFVSCQWVFGFVGLNWWYELLWAIVSLWRSGFYVVGKQFFLVCMSLLSELMVAKPKSLNAQSTGLHKSLLASQIDVSTSNSDTMMVFYCSALFHPCFGWVGGWVGGNTTRQSFYFQGGNSWACNLLIWLLLCLFLK